MIRPTSLAFLLTVLTVLTALAACAPQKVPLSIGDEGGARDRGEGDDGDEGEGEGEGEGEEGEGEGEEGEGEGEGEAGEGEGEGEPVTCEDGFVANGSSCRPAGLAALTERSEDSVCARWSTDFVSVFPEWEPTPGSEDPCDVGTVPEAALDNALTRLNLYRWLVGVPAAALEPQLFAQQQACAVQMAALGYLTHQPAPEMACYTQDGAAGAGSSNISGGSGLAGSVDAYVWDGGNETHFGHRRWVLGPYMSVTQFGVKNGFSCMYSFSLGAQETPPAYVAYPPPGYVPTYAAAGEFTFSSQDFAPTSETRVELSVDGAPFVEAEVAPAQGSFGHWGAAISFAKNADPNVSWRSLWVEGKVVRVRVLGTTGGDVEYTVVFTGC